MYFIKYVILLSHSYMAPYNPTYPREWIIQDAVRARVHQQLHNAQEVVYNAAQTLLQPTAPLNGGKVHLFFIFIFI